MIYDTLSNISNYVCLYNRIDAVADFLSDNDLKTLEPGKYLIDGEDVYVNIVETTLKNEEESVYELHKKYLDIHIDLIGKEIIQFADEQLIKSVTEYNAEEDYQLINGDSTVKCLLDSSHFVICMLDEPHMPCLKYHEFQNIKKAIIKVLA